MAPTGEGELFDIGNGFAFYCNPGGRFHGWIFTRHPDGQFVSVRKCPLTTSPVPAIFQGKDNGPDG